MMFLKIQTKDLDSRKHLLFFPRAPLVGFFSAVFVFKNAGFQGG